MKSNKSAVLLKSDEMTESELQRGFSYHHRGIIWISSTLVLILLLLLTNTFYMQRKLAAETHQYVSDISSYAAQNITDALNANRVYIEDLADVFSRIPEFQRTNDLLKRKAQTWSLDGLAIVSPDGIRVLDDVFCERFYNWLEQHDEIYSHAGVSYILNHKVIYYAPIKSDEPGKKLALIGVNNDSSVQQMLEKTSFQNRGRSLIVDYRGEIVFEPAQLQSIEDIHSPNQEDGDNLSTTIYEMLARGYEGVFPVNNGGAETLMVSIQPLDVSGWLLLTVVPADLLGHATTRPIFFFIAITMLCSVAFWGIMRYFYRSQKKLIDQLRSLAFHDQLTDMPNSNAFMIDARRLLSETEPGSYALVFFNIRSFKHINERWGTTEGNRVLRYISRMLAEQLQPDELAARSEIDHYFLLLHNAPPEQLTRRLEEMAAQINHFHSIPTSVSRANQDEHFSFQFSIGVYAVTDAQEDFKIALGKARRAAAGDGDSPVGYYDNEAVHRELYLRHLSEIFDKALQNEHFQVYLQPKVPLRDDLPLAAEALVRWDDPQEGLIFPSDFIPMLETSGAIRQLDFYMFEHICRLVRQRIENDLPVFPVSVNLSRAHLNSGNIDFITRLVDIKNQYGIPDGVLEIELTESISIQDTQLPLIKQALDELHRNGMTCSLDDFGFGYSSLAILQSLNVDAIKFDRKFFLVENDRTWYVVASFIKLAHGLGMKAVAEGIEEAGQVEKLKQSECDLVQGYCYSRPLPADEFEKWRIQHLNHNKEQDAGEETLWSKA